jgi:hypothetical protein
VEVLADPFFFSGLQFGQTQTLAESYYDSPEALKNALNSILIKVGFRLNLGGYKDAKKSRCNFRCAQYGFSEADKSLASKKIKEREMEGVNGGFDGEGEGGDGGIVWGRAKKKASIRCGCLFRLTGRKKELEGTEGNNCENGGEMGGWELTEDSLEKFKKSIVEDYSRFKSGLLEPQEGNEMPLHNHGPRSDLYMDHPEDPETPVSSKRKGKAKIQPQKQGQSSEGNHGALVLAGNGGGAGAASGDLTAEDFQRILDSAGSDDPLPILWTGATGSSSTSLSSSSSHAPGSNNNNNNSNNWMLNSDDFRSLSSTITNNAASTSTSTTTTTVDPPLLPETQKALERQKQYNELWVLSKKVLDMSFTAANATMRVKKLKDVLEGQLKELVKQDKTHQQSQFQSQSQTNTQPQKQQTQTQKPKQAQSKLNGVASTSAAVSAQSGIEMSPYSVVVGGSSSTGSAAKSPAKRKNDEDATGSGEDGQDNSNNVDMSGGANKKAKLGTVGFGYGSSKSLVAPPASQQQQEQQQQQEHEQQQPKRQSRSSKAAQQNQIQQEQQQPDELQQDDGSGATRYKYRCSICGSFMHTKPKCPMKGGNNGA